MHAGVALCILLEAALPARSWATGQAAPLNRVAGIPLPNVAGRIDHLALDTASRRLFVAALGNDTVEVVDLTRNLPFGRIDGLHEPQGLLHLPGAGRLFVTNGANASISTFASSSFAAIDRIDLREDPDNVRFEPDQNRVWVGEGAGTRGALAAIPADGSAVAFEIPLDGHPESFQLESNGPRIFVNVPAEQEVEVLDRERRKVVARWKLPCAGNYPMAIENEARRVLVGCRAPPLLLVLDADTGSVLSVVTLPGDVDDIFVDRASARVYASAGEGLLRVFSQEGTGNLRAMGDVPTRAGARTSLFDPETRRLYVAAPRRGKAPAEILVFDAEN